MSEGSGPVRQRPRQRCVRSTAKEHAALRKRARAAGKNISRYLIDCALADATAHPLEARSEEQQLALRSGLLEVVELVRMVGRELPGCGGLSLFDAIEILARERAR